MIPDGARKQFANTFKEWHYLAGGASAGFAAGVYVGLKWAVKYEEATD